MRRTARTGLTALSLAILFGLTACASVSPPPAQAQAEAVRYAQPAPPTLAQPMLASLPPSVDLVKQLPAPEDSGPNIVRASKRVSCVPFARVVSGINLAGNAKLWWSAARGKYIRSMRPEPGSVMVFSGSKRLRRGHLAVVRSVVSEREIRVDHANWMSDGRIYTNVAVIDVSERNDWSKVRVWNGVGGGQMGTRVYAVSGFITPRTVASARNAAIN